MSGPSGLFSQLGLKKETIYGTRVTPDHFYEFDSETFKRDPTYLAPQGLHAGTLAQLGSRVKQTTRQAPGGITMDVPSKGFGAILDLLHGAVAAPVQNGATAAWTSTHPIGSTAANKSATIQFNKPDSSATDRPFDYVGCMLTQAVFSCDVGGSLKVALTFDGQDEQTNQALAVASYPTGLHSFDFTQATVNYGGALGFVKSIGDLTIAQGMATDRWFMGATGLKAKPLPNAFIAVSGTITAEFSDLATLYNVWVAGTQQQMVIDFQGPIIASTFHEEITFTMPAVQLRGDTPNISGADVLELQVPFVAFFDGTNPVATIAYTSTDTTL